MNELDFSGKQVLVVGGSSGIGNGIAQAFRAKGARVQVCGTRAARRRLFGGGGIASRRSRLRAARRQRCAGDRGFQPVFDRLDVLVLAQGAVIYRRGEFEMDGFRKVLEVNLMSLMACATKFHPMLRAAKGLADHRQLDRRLSFDQGQSGLQCLEDRRGRADPDAWAGLGRGWHPRQRHRARPGRYQDDQGDDLQSEAARRRDRADTAEAAGDAGRHGGRRAVSGLAAGVLHRRSNPGRRRRPHPVTKRRNGIGTGTGSSVTSAENRE